MRVFTILGVLFLVLGIGLVVVSMLPGGDSSWDAFREGGAFFMALTFIPMGIVFTAIGLVLGRLTSGRRRLLREGIAGQATILSLSGGNMVVNNINYLMTFRLRVVLPGRAPYDVDHRQLVPIFALASLPVGATVPVMVDPRSPGTLTIDLGGEAAGTRQVTAISAAPSQVLPNTLSTRQGSAPNTFSSDPAGAVTAWPAMSQSGVTPVPSGAAQHQAGMALDQAHMIVGLLARSGIRLDPGALAQGAMTIAPATTIDAGQPSQGTSATLLASGRPGAAVIRDARDTGIVVHGDPVVELTLDVSPPGEAAHEVRTATLVPAAARARLLPGVTVPVRIDLAQPDRLAIDWQA